MLDRYGKDKNGLLVKKAVVYTKNEHHIQREKIDSDAIKIIERLKECGYSAYIVGGAVRDLLIGNSPKDFDIVTDATPSKIRRIFRCARIIGRRFRLVHIVFGSKIFEVSTFRSIAKGSIGNNFGSMDEDVMRRDFTMNALYYDPILEQVIDYVGGVRDIRKGALTPVIPLERIFEEDPVRMLRAVKYSVTTHCKMSWQVRHKIKKSALLLAEISRSRLTEEFFKIVNSSHSAAIIKEAFETDLYVHLQHEASVRILGDKNFEKKYFESLAQLDELCIAQKDARLGKKLAFLIRDFIFSEMPSNVVIEDENCAAEFWTKIWTKCRRFMLPVNPPRTELEYAVRNVLREMGVNISLPKIAVSQKKAAQGRTQFWRIKSRGKV